jgi:hypothetical protein
MTMRTSTTCTRVLLTILVGLFLTGTAQAQTATTTTTLASAVTSASANTVVLTSATGATAGGSLWIDRELLTVISASGTTIRVARGAGGTAAKTHGALAVVYVATAAQSPYVFIATDPGGACTSTNERFLPQVNPRTGGIWDCVSTVGLWVDRTRTVTVTCTAHADADFIDQSCFIVDRPYVIYSITEVHTVAESGGTVGIAPRRQQGTEAVASGDLLLATAFSGLSTAQTVVTGTLTATPAFLLLSAGERIGLDFTNDDPGEMLGVTVTFTLYPR